MGSFAGRRGDRLGLAFFRALALVLFIAQTHIVGKEGENGEQGREGTSVGHFVEQLEVAEGTLAVFIGRETGFGSVVTRDIDLASAVNDDVERVVGVEGQGVACNESAGLEVAGEFVENGLFQEAKDANGAQKLIEVAS